MLLQLHTLIQTLEIIITIIIIQITLIDTLTQYRPIHIRNSTYNNMYNSMFRLTTASTLKDSTDAVRIMQTFLPECTMALRIIMALRITTQLPIITIILLTIIIMRAIIITHITMDHMEEHTTGMVTTGMPDFK
jgi:hypothetical protein